MRGRVLAVVGLVVAGGLVAGCGEEGSADQDIRTVTVTAAAGATAPATEPVVAEPEPADDERPDGKYTFRCNYILGDFTSNTPSGYRFVADATVTNTGNVGTISRVTAIWDQVGTEAVKSTKTIRVKAGGKRKVGFTLPVSQEQIDLHQSADGECTVRSRIIDTFGPVS